MKSPKRTKLLRVGMVVGAVAIIAAACAPAPPPPPPAPQVQSCSDVGTGGDTLANCHNQIHPYTIDGAATSLAQTSVARFAGATCATPLTHIAPPSGWSENLFCQDFAGATSCASDGFAAVKALNAWLNSPPHHATIDTYSGGYVGAATICSQGHYLFAAAEYHH